MKPHAAASNSQLHLRAYYINLDVSGDRRAHIEDQISRVGLEGVRINAIDGREVALFDPRIDPYSFHLCHHALLRPGEVGCYLSHIKALETFLESGDDFALILEDDAVLHCELPSVLRHLSDKRYEWDIAKLYATHVSGIVSQSQLGSSHKLITTCFKHSSSAAYALTERLLSALCTAWCQCGCPMTTNLIATGKLG